MASALRFVLGASTLRFVLGASALHCVLGASTLHYALGASSAIAWTNRRRDGILSSISLREDSESEPIGPASLSLPLLFFVGSIRVWLVTVLIVLVQ